MLSGRLIRNEPRRPRREEGPPDGLGLFMSYYLGVTIEDTYQKPSLDETARRFSVSPDEVKELLVEHKLDRQTLEQTDFDLEGAKLDVRLAPEGISRIEIARGLYDEYLEFIKE